MLEFGLEPIDKDLESSQIIFQADVIVLDLNTKEILKGGYRGTEIHILSDSDASLKTFNQRSCGTILMW